MNRENITHFCDTNIGKKYKEKIEKFSKLEEGGELTEREKELFWLMLNLYAYLSSGIFAIQNNAFLSVYGILNNMSCNWDSMIKDGRLK